MRRAACWAVLTLMVLAGGYLGIGLFVAARFTAPNRQPAERTPADVGLRYREVSLESTDGVPLFIIHSTAYDDHVIGMLRVFSGGSGHLDEVAMRDLVGRDVDRTVNIASSQINHFVIDVGEPFRDRLGEIDAPTLVVHGAKDPVFPLGDALALEKEIPGARLLVLEQTGHELPPAVWNVVLSAILRHTSGGWSG